MKKRAYSLLILFVCIVMVFALCACSNQDNSGLSAYEIAVKNGFEGTEAEWLKSLHTTNDIKETTNNYNVNVETSHDVSVATNIGLKSAVSIYCRHTVTERVYVGMYPFGQYQMQEKQVQSAGSGVIYQLEDDGSAYIITNHHVVYENDSITTDHISDDISVFLYGMENSQYAIPATYVGGSLNYDIAVLRIESNQLIKSSIEKGTVANVNFADSNEIRVGQTSIAIGNPEAEGISVTCGIVSVDSEYITMKAVDEQTVISLRVIRTDTAVNGGNSGGGLFDDTGKLIGIVNAKVSDSSVENIAYAIPCNVAKAIAQNIIDYNKLYNKNCVMRVILGVTLQSNELSTRLDDNGFIVKTETVAIAEINENSIVKDVLQVGDVIQSVKIADNNALTIERNYQFVDAMLNARVDDEIVIEYVRNGQKAQATFTITEGCLTEY